MGKYTNEKGLIVVQDNFLTKIKKFFIRTFFNREPIYEDYDYDLEENENDNNNENNTQYCSQGEEMEKERKLFDFDAEDTGDWPVNEINYVNEQYENNNQIDGIQQYTCDEDNNNIQNEGDEIDYEKEEYSQAYIEKQEIEQKLLNYYQSIKKGM